MLLITFVFCFLIQFSCSLWCLAQTSGSAQQTLAQQQQHCQPPHLHLALLLLLQPLAQAAALA
jgi:hypothetical protein